MTHTKMTYFNAVTQTTEELDVTTCKEGVFLVN